MKIFLIIIVFLTSNHIDAQTKQVSTTELRENADPLNLSDSINYQNKYSWCNPGAWPNNQVPQLNQDVMIMPGTKIVLDCQAKALGNLHIHGELFVKSFTNIHLKAKSIHVMGSGAVFRIGSKQNPYKKRVVLELTGARGVHTPSEKDNSLDNDGQSRAIHVMSGGRLSFFGATKNIVRTKLNQHAQKSSKIIQVEDDVSTWNIGDRIAISITDFYDPTKRETEVHKIKFINGKTIELEEPLQSFRWGLLQYPMDDESTNSSMTLNSQATFTPATAVTPKVLDQRAWVVNLERNIIIRGADDKDWRNHGFGVHTMAMGIDSTYRLSGVMFERAGQKRAMGRYPVHWHMVSFQLSGNHKGAFLGLVDPNNHFVENSVIYNSVNRAVTVHGTSGVRVENNMAVDIKNHAFFLEDGSETKNKIINNMAMKVRSSDEYALKEHDKRPAGFWITHPTNDVIDNYASDADHGLWNSFARQVFGLSALVGAMNPLQPSEQMRSPEHIVYGCDNVFIPSQSNCDDAPYRAPLGIHRGNIAHSNKEYGIRTEHAVQDEAGNTSDSYFEVGCHNTQAGEPFKHCVAKLTDNRVWKNNLGNYNNRIHAVEYERWISADSQSGFSGAVREGFLRDSLFIGESLNNSSNLPSALHNKNRYGVASYHFSIDIIDTTAVNFYGSNPEAGINSPHIIQAGGFFLGSDLYLDSTAQHMVRNSGWQFRNAMPGYLAPPPAFDGVATFINNTHRSWGIAPVVDIYGYWGPAGNTMIPNNLFYTYQLNPLELNTPEGSGRISTPHPFVGIQSFHINSSLSNENTSPLISLNDDIQFDRLASQGLQYPLAYSTVATHSLPYYENQALGDFRHSNIPVDGHMRVRFPNHPYPNDLIRFAISNYGILDSSESVVVVLPWAGGSVEAFLSYNDFYEGLYEGVSDTPPTADSYFERNLEASENLEHFISQTTNPIGKFYYYSPSENLLYLKISGGLDKGPQLQYKCDLSFNPETEIHEGAQGYNCMSDLMWVQIRRQ